VSGAVQGVILSSDPLSGAAAGATGAIVAETTAMNLPSSLAPRTRANIGRIAAGVTTLVTNQDVNTAITTATTAVENNWLHPAPTLEIEKNRQEIEDAGTEALGEVLGTEIPPLAHHQQTAFNQAKTFFEEANQALQTPNLSSWGRMALLRQRNAALEFMGQAQTLPTTVGDATLIGAGLVGGSMGQASQFAKEGVKFFKLGQQWGKGLRQATRLAPIPEEISVFTKQRPVHLSRNLEGLDLKAIPVKQGQEKVHATSSPLSTTTIPSTSRTIPSSTTAATNHNWTTSTSSTTSSTTSAPHPYSTSSQATTSQVHPRAVDDGGFKGRKGFELRNAPYQNVKNTLTMINNREFSGHALDQMQNRGIMPSIVENTIKEGIIFSTKPGTIGYYDRVNNLRIVTNAETGKVITIIPGDPFQ